MSREDPAVLRPPPRPRPVSSDLCSARSERLPGSPGKIFSNLGRLEVGTGCWPESWRLGTCGLPWGGALLPPPAVGVELGPPSPPWSGGPLSLHRRVLLPPQFPGVTWASRRDSRQAGAATVTHKDSHVSILGDRLSERLCFPKNVPPDCGLACAIKTLWRPVPPSALPSPQEQDWGTSLPSAKARKAGRRADPTSWVQTREPFGSRLPASPMMEFSGLMLSPSVLLELDTSSPSALCSGAFGPLLWEQEGVTRTGVVTAAPLQGAAQVRIALPFPRHRNILGGTRHGHTTGRWPRC